MEMPYYLVDNPLTPDPNDFRARLQLKGRMRRADIVKRIMRKNSGLAESELIAVFDEERRVIEELLEEGYSVDTGLVLIQPGLKGVFHTATEAFSPGKHELKMNVSALKVLKEAVQKITLVKVVNGISLPVVTVFEDIISETSNATITPGKSAKIFGDKLKFDKADADQGIFFIKEDETETRVEEYTEIGNKKLIFNIAQGLTKGNYTVQVSGKTTAGALREGTLKAVLKVA